MFPTCQSVIGPARTYRCAGTLRARTEISISGEYNRAVWYNNVHALTSRLRFAPENMLNIRIFGAMFSPLNAFANNFLR